MIKIDLLMDAEHWEIFLILELFLENNLGDNEENCIDFISCIPVDKNNPLMPLEYSFTV